MLTIRMLHRKAITVLGMLAIEADIELAEFYELPLEVFLKLLREKRRAKAQRRMN